MVALALTLALAPGAHVTVADPTTCYLGINSVRAGRHQLVAHWRDQNTLETWRARGGSVTFNGITIRNGSHQRVIVKASC
jgi:hypothetical protein